MVEPISFANPATNDAGLPRRMAFKALREAMKPTLYHPEPGRRMEPHDLPCRADPSPSVRAGPWLCSAGEPRETGWETAWMGGRGWFANRVGL